MPTLAEILKDKKAFADNVEITINDAKFTVGDLRAHQDATGIDIAKQLDSEKASIAKQYEDLRQAQLAVAAAYEQIGKQQNNVGQTRTTPAGDDWRNDPFFSGPAGSYKEMADKLAAYDTRFNQQQEALVKGIKWVMDKFTNYEYRSLPEDFRKETSYEAALRTANDKRYLDPAGVPDFSKVYSDWNAPREREALKATLRTEIEQEMRTNEMKAMMPRPGSAGPGTVENAGAPVHKNLHEAMNAAKQDPDIWAQIYGTRQ